MFVYCLFVNMMLWDEQTLAAMKLMVILNLYICVSLKSRYLILMNTGETPGIRHRRASCDTAVTSERSSSSSRRDTLKTRGGKVKCWQTHTTFNTRDLEGTITHSFSATSRRLLREQEEEERRQNVIPQSREEWRGETRQRQQGEDGMLIQSKQSEAIGRESRKTRIRATR